MTGGAGKPGPRRLERAGIAAVAILVVMVLVIFFGRTLWHATEVEEAPPAIDQTQRP